MGLKSGTSTDRVSKREVALARAKVAGYENDTRTFTRLLVESRVRRELLNEAWHKGRSQKENERSKVENGGETSALINMSRGFAT